MSGNSFGRSFTVTTFGESHGLALGRLSMAAHLALSLAKPIFRSTLICRKPARRASHQRREEDQSSLSGRLTAKPYMPDWFADRKHRPTLQRLRQHCQHLSPCSRRLRLHQKYGFRDYRGGGRSSARRNRHARGRRCNRQKVLAQKAF